MTLFSIQAVGRLPFLFGLGNNVEKKVKLLSSRGWNVVVFLSRWFEESLGIPNSSIKQGKSRLCDSNVAYVNS